MSGFLSALPVGVLLGGLLGPLRLAGIDYSQWYRNRAELSEGTDRSWIGLMKRMALCSGGLFVLGALIVVIVVGFRTSVGAALLDLLGLAIGAAVIQAGLETAWRLGLGADTGQQLEIRLARPSDPRIQGSAVRAPVADRRRLIICCDGTWNSPVERQETNVVHLLRAINPLARVDEAPVQQIVHYHLGVGTGNFLDRFLGGGAGIGLSSSVKACYGFLVDNYRPSDEILLFGFSRGAYVVRSVAGMIGVVGLLRKHEMFRFLDAWDYYVLSPAKRARYRLDDISPQGHRQVEIRCLGVWDTVGALAIPGTRACSSAYAFHQTSLGPHIRYAFQALAIDEMRGNFQPAVWARGSHDQVLEQVWFPGVHSNIGGGYQRHGLSDATLLWMLSRLNEHQLLDFDPNCIVSAIGRYHAEPLGAGESQDSRTCLWKAIACPIPRPVGITDDSETIHQTAFNRGGIVAAGDPYAASRRQAWLATIPNEKIAPISDFEKNFAYQGAGTGTVVSKIVDPSRGLCDRLLRWLFGQA